MILFSCYYHAKAIIKKFFYKIIYFKRIKIGKNVTWRNQFSVLIDRGAKVEIGDNCFFNNNCSLASHNKIKIGAGTLIGENVKIYDHNHRFNRINVPIKNQGYTVAPVSIGKHCWIGSNVVILKGVTIGNNCVIGAGCVISQNIKDNTIVKQSNKLEEIPLIVRKY